MLIGLVVAPTTHTHADNCSPWLSIDACGLLPSTTESQTGHSIGWEGFAQSGRRRTRGSHPTSVVLSHWRRLIFNGVDDTLGPKTELMIAVGGWTLRRCGIRWCCGQGYHNVAGGIRAPLHSVESVPDSSHLNTLRARPAGQNQSTARPHSLWWER